MGEAGVKLLNEFIAGNNLDIGEALETDLRQLRHLIVSNHLSDHRGIPENSRLLRLAEHLIQIAFEDLQAVTGKNGCHQGRRIFFTHRR